MIKTKINKCSCILGEFQSCSCPDRCVWYQKYVEVMTWLIFTSHQSVLSHTNADIQFTVINFDRILHKVLDRCCGDVYSLCTVVMQDLICDNHKFGLVTMKADRKLSGDLVHWSTSALLSGWLAYYI